MPSKCRPLLVLSFAAWSVFAAQACDTPPPAPTPSASSAPAVVSEPAATPSQLQGVVTLAGIPSMMAALPGARVEVVSGQGIGRSTVTTEWGGYLLTGVEGPVTIKATADGLTPFIKAIDVSGDSLLNIGLSPSGAIPTIAGTYTLTVRAGADCAASDSDGGLPEDARVRRYLATVTQTGSRLDVKLSGASFHLVSSQDWLGNNVMLGDGFLGYVAPERVEFFLEGTDDPTWGSYPSLDEALGDGRTLVIRGSVSALAGSAIAGTMRGKMLLYSRGSVRECSSDRHEFTLAR